MTAVMPRVRLVALDVDGTLLTPDHRIASSSVEAISAARRLGTRVVLASSRGPGALESVQVELGLVDEWFVAYQGALVARRLHGRLEVLTDRRVPSDAATEVESRGTAAGLSVGRYIGGRWLVPSLTPAISREAAITGERPVLATVHDDDAPHKLLVIAENPAEIPALERLADGLEPGLAATFSHPTYLEITAAGVDKGSGVRTLLDHLQVPQPESAAVGDGLNDLGLFRAVGYGIAMRHAPPGVRAVAHWTTSSNTEDGVAVALAHLDLWQPDQAAGTELAGVGPVSAGERPAGRNAGRTT